MKTKKTYTFWIEHPQGGSHYVTAAKGETYESALQVAMELCAEDWQEDIKNLRLLGSAEGDVVIVEWHEPS